ncbi:MAG: ATP-dependent DNA helicase [Spirochaetaceae bacterium]|nr:ATP-dependent DNA helicase [Spirochaetaceae bacterium]
MSDAPMNQHDLFVTGADGGPVPSDDPGPRVDVEEGLHRLGLRSFRAGQREAVETLLEARRLLLVAPTGGGKSLTYQLPAALLPGTTVVVSPLIALMHDQVAALEQRGVTATYLAGTLPFDEVRRRVAALARGAFKLVYVAPERLANTWLRAALERIDCPLVAVDEAHCISTWGHDFRPDYLQIEELLQLLPRARVLACTATATPVVRDEILERLGLPAGTPQMIHGFARPNLALRAAEVLGKRERDRFVDGVLVETLSTPGAAAGTAIVYAPTRRGTEEEAARLARRGWAVEAYHAGMSGEQRDRVQTAFMAGELEVVVATNAFGMGIDRADVRCVAHLAPPGSLEAYYQEAGRAGRDGEPAVCLLLVSPGDMALRRHLIERDADGGAADAELVRHKWNLFLELMRWAEGGSCRHDAILRYFGDEAETLAGCGRCDVCLRLADEPEQDEQQITVLVRKALSAVARVHTRFGLAAAVKLLKGAADARLQRAGLHHTPTFGILGDHPEEWLLRLLRRCVTAGWVDFSGGDRPVVAITPEGRAVMHGRRPARLLLPPRLRYARVEAAGRGAHGTAAAHAAFQGGLRMSADGAGAAPAGEGAELDARGRELFEALRAFRLAEARRQKVPPYVIASDRSLRDIARLRPGTPGALELAHGIGPTKVERYGAAILEIVRQSE